MYNSRLSDNSKLSSSRTKFSKSTRPTVLYLMDIRFETCFSKSNFYVSYRAEFDGGQRVVVYEENDFLQNNRKTRKVMRREIILVNR